MQQSLKPLWILISYLFVPSSALAGGLVSSYQQAVASDPVFRASVAARNVVLENVSQSTALLLPDISLFADVSRDRFEEREPVIPSLEEFRYTNKTYTVRLRQVLYRHDRFVGLMQANSRAAQADARFVAAQHDLIIRVATRYFSALAARDNLNFVKADTEAIDRALGQAKKLFRAGLVAVTDVYEAQARYDIAISDQINAENLLEDSKEAMRELTGEMLQYLGSLQPDISLHEPVPANQDAWVATAVQQNPLLLAARAATQSAHQEIQIQRSGHYPTLDLTADYSYRDNSFGGGIPLERNDSAVGIELTIPIFQGGLVLSRTRQARDGFSQAQENQLKQRREIERQSRDSYRGVLAEISKVIALKQAVLSNTKAREASEAGFKAGTRTIIDVLNSQRDLLRAKRDYARSRYDYLLETLRLKQAAGVLNKDDIEQVDGLLGQD